MVALANKKRSEVEYDVGDWLYLKLKPYRQTSLAHHSHPKLAPRYVGPYQVVSRVGKVAYNLALLPTWGIYPVFHVSVLKKATSTNLPILPIPTNLAPDLSFVLQPAEVLGLRNSPTEEGSSEVLIRWEHSFPIDATCEVFSVIKDQHPDFHFEDKVALWGAGNDRPRSLRFMLGEMQERIRIL
ncbi:Ty3/gypsy retrotransposon protein [Cucumis melo var. makuwa]|uniref:Ty3/gypsy retrotransposon protein n=1 Tax=Cucumis melo var. makuwa TaxID=1194695 RepID=A0A5D3B7S6_CUCMM|nr:Ty3/gypsy retrotransposon protein [Cucumis melo var. makuwa]TYJ95902.1 Ty3/gypsy retrotransposon protein [Cucumis melo var. makuwa]